MNVTYEEIAEIPKNISPVSIIVNGKNAGKVEPYGRCYRIRWHACIEIPGAPTGNSLAQGFGETIDDAVEDAFSKSRKEAEQYLKALEAMRCEMDV